jgi:spermidine synthase
LKYLFREVGNHHEITVADTTELYGEKGNFRVLQFSNEAVQGAMDLNHPERVVLEYPRAMIHLMEYNDPSFEDVFVIGHGIGTIAGYFPDKRCKIAELDQTVADLSERFFGYKLSNVVVGDGRHILEQELNHTYDYIILDAFTSRGTPKHLLSKEFFSITSEKLNSQGVLLINVIGRGDNDSLINAIHTTLGEVYEYIESFSLAEGAGHIQNIILAASFRPIRYQARHMAGFKPFDPGQAYVIWDG